MTHESDINRIRASVTAKHEQCAWTVVICIALGAAIVVGTVIGYLIGGGI